MYGLESPDCVSTADMAWVKTLDEGTTGDVVDRGYRLYPIESLEPNFHELEYFVHLDRAREVVPAMRELMLGSQPDAVFPLELRTVAADSAYLSPQYEQPTLVLSVSGKPGTDYWPYLRAVDRLLGESGARVHWGKLHFLTAEQLHARYPRAQAFIDVRRRLDPDGVYLNDHLRELFA
jgi:FAD/FMN-containing dehydrogenase